MTFLKDDASDALEAIQKSGVKDKLPRPLGKLF